MILICKQFPLASEGSWATSKNNEEKVAQACELKFTIAKSAISVQIFFGGKLKIERHWFSGIFLSAITMTLWWLQHYLEEKLSKLCHFSCVRQLYSSESPAWRLCISWRRVLVKSPFGLHPLSITKCILSEETKGEGKANHKAGIGGVGFCGVGSFVLLWFFPEHFIR